MADTPSNQLWIGRLSFVALALVIIFAQLLPIDGRPERWPFPDLLLAATFVWVSRRPDLVPVSVIAIVFLFSDLLLQRPPGLWAALVVLGSEFLRTRSKGLRDIPLILEWASVAGVMIAITILYRFALALVLSEQAPLGMTLLQLIFTILIYPMVMLVARFGFGVTRPALGQVDTYGHRI